MLGLSSSLQTRRVRILRDRYSKFTGYKLITGARIKFNGKRGVVLVPVCQHGFSQERKDANPCR